MGSIDWTVVVANAITTIPALIAVILAHRIHRGAKFLIEQTQTPSGTPIGKQVEQAHVTAISNNQLLTKINKGVNGGDE